MWACMHSAQKSSTRFARTESHSELVLTTTLQTRSELRPLRAVSVGGLGGDASYPWDLLWLINISLTDNVKTRGPNYPNQSTSRPWPRLHDESTLMKTC